MMMNALALAVALFSVSAAPISIKHNAGVMTVAAVTVSSAASHIAALDPVDPLPKCYPYCK
jgi:hypothetical protein